MNCPLPESDDRLEFPLAQGWCRGLTIGFETTASSAALDLGQFLHVKQVHGDKILEPSFRDLQSGGLLATPADGLCLTGGQILEVPFGLLIKTADCLPLVYVHRTEPRVAIVHAGWRGLQQGIHLKPFRELGFEPRDTWVWLGPSLNGDAFEAGEDLWSQFAEKNDPEIFTRHPQLAADRRYFSPWKKVEKDFSALGVELLYNVEVNTGHTEAFSSWRRCKKAGLGSIPQQNYSWIRMNSQHQS